MVPGSNNIPAEGTSTERTGSSAESGYTIRQPTYGIEKTDLYLLSSDRVAFPTRKSWLEAFSGHFSDYPIDLNSAEYKHHGLDLPGIELGPDSRVLEKLVGYINSTYHGATPKETDHDVAFKVLQLAQDYQMPIITSLMTYQLM